MTLGQFSAEIAEVVESCRPAVATIHAQSASGSGFLIDNAGSVITNYHVVEGRESGLQLQFTTGLAQPAVLVGIDPLTDLAVLRAEGPVPEPLRVRPSPPVLGEVCLAMGSPLGDYTESVSLGIVSGVARTIPTSRGRPLERAIQTDAAINPGNSGGPLIDVEGQILGVCTCTDARAVLIGFAIPGETLDWVARQIVQYGDVRRGALGVAVASRVENIDGRLRHAPVITRVPAEASSGLRPGDIILALAGRSVADRADLYYLLTRDTIGNLITVEVWRDGRHVLYEVPVKEYVPPPVVSPE